MLTFSYAIVRLSFNNYKKRIVSKCFPYGWCSCNFSFHILWQLTTKTLTMKRYVTKPTSKIKNKEINLFIIMKEWDWHGNSSLAVCFFSVIIITVLVVTCKWSVARIVTYDTYVVYKTRDNVTYLAPRKEFKIRREENYFTESLLELWVVWHCAISPFDC